MKPQENTLKKKKKRRITKKKKLAGEEAESAAPMPPVDIEVRMENLSAAFNIAIPIQKPSPTGRTPVLW